MYPALNSHAQSSLAPRRLGGAFRTETHDRSCAWYISKRDDANDELRIEVAGGGSHGRVGATTNC
jgi:hypothetical protein